MNTKNTIINYFVLYDANNPEKGPLKMWSTPFYINTDTFNKKLSNYNIYGRILHVCWDLNNQLIYLPEERPNFIQEQQVLLDKIKQKISQIHRQNSPLRIYISGNPYFVFRVRKVDDFPEAVNFIKKHLKDMSYCGYLRVIEADLSKMPETVKMLKLNSSDIPYLYVSKNFFGNIHFVQSEASGSHLLCVVPPPFILININPTIFISELEKIRMVIDCYIKHIEEGSSKKTDSNIFNLKYLLSLGWTIKDLSSYVLNISNINTLDKLLHVGTLFVQAIYELQTEQQYYVLNNSFFYIIKRTPQCPIVIPTNITHTYNTQNQNIILQLIAYDDINDYITLRSFLYIPKDILINIFHTTDVNISQYNIYDNKVLLYDSITQNTKQSYKQVAQNIKKELSFQPSKLTAEKVTNELKFWFEKRKIENFNFAANMIKKMCKNSKVDFKNLDVFLGPFSIIVPGFKGGFLAKEEWKKTKQEQKQHEDKADASSSLEIVPGVVLYDDAILIDTQLHTSIADISDALIHEYQHYIDKFLHIEKTYNITDLKDRKNILIYLNDPLEQRSHIQQAVYLLSCGLTRDQILYRFLGSYPNVDNLDVAFKYNEFIDEAFKIINQQQIQEKEKAQEEEKKQEEKDQEKQKEEKQEEPKEEPKEEQKEEEKEEELKEEQEEQKEEEPPPQQQEEEKKQKQKEKKYI